MQEDQDTKAAREPILTDVLARLEEAGGLVSEVEDWTNGIKDFLCGKSPNPAETKEAHPIPPGLVAELNERASAATHSLDRILSTLQTVRRIIGDDGPKITVGLDSREDVVVRENDQARYRGCPG